MPATQATRPIGITTPLGLDVLLLRGFVLREQLGRPFIIDADLELETAHLRGPIKWDKLVGHPVSIRMDWPKGRRHFNGYVSRLVQLPNHGTMARFKATIVPWLWLLTRNSDCRIFQEMKTDEILSDIFTRHGFSDFEFHLRESYAKREFCVQYRETEFNFVSRMMEQEGMYYWFDHEESKHTFRLADSISASKKVKGYESIPYSQVDRGTHEREIIYDWIVEQEVQPVGYTMTDFDFKKPHATLLATSGIARPHGSAKFEIFDYPGEYVEFGDGERLARTRIEELQVRHEVFRAQTTVRGLHAGAVFSLESHPLKDLRKEYLITSQVLSIDTGGYEASGGNEQESFNCTFTAIDAQEPFRPDRTTPKPSVQGPQTALVVGPAGEEIYTDPHARVKVHFHWDRHHAEDETASCWIRVSQPWAGKGWGSMATPRIGQEVVVDFLEGDPDRPLIVGRVYNGEQPPPYSSGQGVVSGLKSKTHKGEGYNEMSMDDTKGKEKVTIHAQYDMGTTVEHDDTQTINNNRTINVRGTHTETVEKATTITLNDTLTETIKKNTTIHITEGDLEHKLIAGKADYSVAKTQCTTVKLQIKAESTDADILEMAKDKIVLDSGAGKSVAQLRPNGEIEFTAAEQIKLITGDSSITLKKDGTITISGKKVTVTGTDTASLGVGNQSVTCSTSEVATTGAAISSAAIGKHEISGAVVKLN